MDHLTADLDLGDYAGTRTPWDSPVWRGEALGWAEGALREAGLREDGGRRRAVRVRPWSVLVRIPVGSADGGPEGVPAGGTEGRPGGGLRGACVWFKANPPGSAFEPALGAALAGWVPAHVLRPYAVDAARGWALWPDGGTLFADVLNSGAPDPTAWEAPLRQYAAMQRALVPYADRARALGVPSLRSHELPQVYARTVADCGALEAAERAGLLAGVPRVEEWCAELAAFGVPDSVDHSDLHEAQVFAPGTGHQDRFAFFDWGDAVVGHPFSSLLVTARSARARYGPEVLPRLRDAYLEPWTGDGRSAAELRRAVSLACRLGAVSRAGSWGRLFPGASAGTGGGSDGADVARWLRELFADPPL